MLSISKEFKICAAHRLLGHRGACANLHGHNYRITVTFETLQTNKLGMVIDFSRAKQAIGQYLDLAWDHATLVWVDDTELTDAIVQLRSKYYVCAKPPTAEYMAAYLLNYPFFDGDTDYYVSAVKVEETDGAYACASLKG